MNILLIRNDKIGDFMLSWPALFLLKHYLPESHVSALVPSYTAPLASLCPWIDTITIDTQQSAVSIAILMRTGSYDAMLTLYSTTRVGAAGMLAKIPYRLAPATKLAQIFYTHRLVQRRSRSEKPEYAYNMDIIFRFLFDQGIHDHLHTSTESNGDWLPAIIQRPILSFNDDSPSLRDNFCSVHQLDPDANLIFIHPGSGGSANNLTPDQYSSLANLLSKDTNCHFIVSAGPGEREIAQQVVDGIDGVAIVYESASGLVEFTRTMQCADLFISGSTGPLHIAGALNLNTAAFYPAHRSATPLRWQTLNSPERRLAFVPPAGSEREVQMIDIQAAAGEITRHFFTT